MPDILVKDLPAPLHQRLKTEAKLHHRSMNQEIRQILEAHLQKPGVPAFKPFDFGRSLNPAQIRQARYQGRA